MLGTWVWGSQPLAKVLFWLTKVKPKAEMTSGCPPKCCIRSDDAEDVFSLLLLLLVVVVVVCFCNATTNVDVAFMSAL